MNQRVAQLEARLDVLERELARPRTVASPQSSRREPDLETTLALTWLNRLGAGLVIIGLALGAGWANDRGYLSPLARNVLLALASLAILTAGSSMLRGADAYGRRFAQGVAAVGAFGLYLAPFTASQIHGLLAPLQVAALCMMLTVALVLGAYLLRVPPLASFGLLGCLSVPLAGSSYGSSLLGLGLVALLYLSIVAFRRPTQSEHLAVAIAAAALASLGYLSTGSPAAPGLVGLVALALAAGLRAAGADPTARRLLFAIGLLGIGTSWVLFAAGWQGSVGVSASLVSYGLALVAVGLSRSIRLCRLLGVTALGLALGKLAVYDLWQAADGLRVAGLFVLGLGLLSASFLYSRVSTRPRCVTARTDSQSDDLRRTARLLD